MRKYLTTIHEKRYFMPPFVGNETELKALAAYLTAGLHKKPLADDGGAAGDRGTVLYEENCAACHSAESIKPKMKVGMAQIRPQIKLLPLTACRI